MSDLERLIEDIVTANRILAGNNVLDTSGLPDGSYALVLRIHEAGGAVREERRFFVRNAQIAPVGLIFSFSAWSRSRSAAVSAP